MIHFSCDRCGKDLTAANGRFVVRMEVFPAFDPDHVSETDLDSDHLEVIADVLRDEPESGEQALEAARCHELRFDLCPNCQRKLIADPLGREASSRAYKYSKN